jgi:hypothetical protein
LTEGRESLGRALEQAISAVVRDNLAPLERTASDLQQAFADLVAACSSSNPSSALLAMLRAQSFASSLSASLSVFSNFVAIAMSPPGLRSVAEVPVRQTAVAVAEPSAQLTAVPDVVSQTQESPLEPAAPLHPVQAQEPEAPAASEHQTAIPEPEVAVHAAAPEAVVPSEPAFDVSTFPTDIQDLHRRANRVAKVAMQDIKLLRPNDVQLGREHNDICERLRSDIDKARKEYDRRFRAIQDHPVDYFHRWMVDILAEGNVEALGKYPYPSPVLRH